MSPNRPISFGIDPLSDFENPADLNTNFVDSRFDWTFTATPVPGPSPLLLFLGGFVGLVLVRRRSQ